MLEFPFHCRAQISTREKLFRWLRQVALPALYPSEVYAGSALLPPWMRSFIVDAAGHLVGSPRLRLLRIKPSEPNASRRSMRSGTRSISSNFHLFVVQETVRTRYHRWRPCVAQPTGFSDRTRTITTRAGFLSTPQVRRRCASHSKLFLLIPINEQHGQLCFRLVQTLEAWPMCTGRTRSGTSWTGTRPSRCTPPTAAAATKRSSAGERRVAAPSPPILAIVAFGSTD